MVTVDLDDNGYYHITMPKGDSATFTIAIKNAQGQAYTPTSSDKISFSVARTWDKTKPVLVKDIPYSTLRLSLSPSDTEWLAVRTYAYDIEIIHNGYTYTVVKGKFNLSGEVSTTRYPDPNPYKTDFFNSVISATTSRSPLNGTKLTVFCTYDNTVTETTYNRSIVFTVGEPDESWNGHILYDGTDTVTTYDSDSGVYRIDAIGYSYSGSMAYA